MNPIDSSAARNLHGAWTTMLCAGLATFYPAVVLGGAPTPAPVETPAPLTNWIGFTIGGAIVNGNDAGFMRRAQQNDDFYGGIESMQYSKALNDSTTLTLDGHALPGLEDYEVNLDLTKTDLGYIKAGYKEFRTWYDGSGGFKPGYNATPSGWIDPITEYDDDLSLDRGELYFEAGLRMENLPEITFGYTHRWRNGQKDSTMWGINEDTTGNEFGTIPAYYNIDETTDIFRLDITHTLGNTDLGLGLNYDIVRNNNSRHEEEGAIVHSDVYEYDLFGASMFSTTRFNERMMLSFGYLFTSLNTDTDGSSREEDGAFSGSHAFPNLNGGSDVSQNVINGNFWWNPIDDLVIVPSVRAEWQNMDSSARGLLDGNTNTGFTSRMFTNSTDMTETTEALEVRYTGLPDLVLYASAEWSQNDQDVTLYELKENSVATTNKYWRDLDSTTDTEKYTIGANWYPVSGLSVSAQYYYKNFEQDFGNDFDSDPLTATRSLDAELKYHAFELNDANLRVTWRAMPNLTFVTRYDYQQREIENQAYYDSAVSLVTDTIESANITSSILTESVTWNASDRFYLQGSVHWIMSQTDTPEDSGPNSVPPGFIPDWDNDYWSASLNAGYALDSKTDITASFNYYGARNYQSVTDGMAYGLNTQEYGASLTLNRMLTPNMVWNLRYGFITSQTDGDDQSGGYNDFTAQMVSTGLQIRF